MAHEPITLEPTKNGWAAFGDGWAIHGATKEEVIARFEETLKKYQEIDARPIPESKENYE